MLKQCLDFWIKRSQLMKSNIFVPLNTHYAYLKKLEIFKLEAAFTDGYKAPDEPVMKRINHKSAVWEIQLANEKTCLMRCDFGAIDDELYVVHVDAQKFYYYWLVSSLYQEHEHRSSDCVLIKDMPKDYKFKYAEEGFAANKNSPVPLAFLSARYVDGHPFIGFTNGVTRTLWLLVNGAKSFPVEVYKAAGAKQLYEFAGIGEPPLSYQQLQDKHEVITPYNLTDESLKRLKESG